MHRAVATTDKTELGAATDITKLSATLDWTAPSVAMEGGAGLAWWQRHGHGEAGLVNGLGWAGVGGASANGTEPRATTYGVGPTLAASE